MKKLLSTITAVAFVMGLGAAGYAQTAGKQAEKPAVKVETPAPPSQVSTQVTPKEPGKVAEPGKAAPATAKKAEEKGKKTAKKTKEMGKKDVNPTDKTKKEGEQPKKAENNR